MGNGPDRLFMPQTGHRAAIDDLEDRTLRFHGGIGTLIENSPHGTVAFGGPVTVVHAGALVVSRACPHPRGQVLRRRKCRCEGANFGKNLLGRIDSKTGDLRQSLYLILVWLEQVGHLLVEFANLFFDQLQLLELILSSRL